jgi:amidase
MSSWQDKAAAHREELIAKIPQEWRLTPTDLETSKQHRDLSVYAETFLSKDELAIVSSDSVSLVNKLASGQLTAQAVTLAFCHAAAVAHQLVRSSLHIPISISTQRGKIDRRHS